MAWSVDQGQTNPTTGEPRPANLELPTFKHINHMYSLQSEHTRSVFSKENIAFSFCKEDKHQLYKRPNEKFFLIFPLKHKIGVHYMCNLNNMLPSWSLPCQEYEHYIPSIKAPGSGLVIFREGSVYKLLLSYFQWKPLIPQGFQKKQLLSIFHLDYFYWKYPNKNSSPAKTVSQAPKHVFLFILRQSWKDLCI